MRITLDWLPTPRTTVSTKSFASITEIFISATRGKNGIIAVELNTELVEPVTA